MSLTVSILIYISYWFCLSGWSLIDTSAEREDREKDVYSKSYKSVGGALGKGTEEQSEGKDNQVEPWQVK